MQESFLPNHPIFDVPESLLNVDSGRSSSGGNDNHKGQTNLMLLRGSDLILAVGKELRMTTVVEAKAPGTSKVAYKVRMELESCLCKA